MEEELGDSQKKILTAAQNPNPKSWNKDELCSAVSSYVNPKYGNYLKEQEVDGDFLLNLSHEKEFVELLKEGFPGTMSKIDEQKLVYIYKSIHKINNIFTTQLSSRNSVSQSQIGLQESNNFLNESLLIKKNDSFQHQNSEKESKPNTSASSLQSQMQQGNQFFESKLVQQANSNLNSQINESQTESIVSKGKDSIDDDDEDEDDDIEDDKDDIDDDDNDDDDDDDDEFIDPAYKLSNADDTIDDDDTITRSILTLRNQDQKLISKETGLSSGTIHEKKDKSPNNLLQKQAKSQGQFSSSSKPSATQYEPKYFNVQISDKWEDDDGDDDDDSDDTIQEIFETRFNSLEDSDTFSKKIQPSRQSNNSIDGKSQSNQIYSANQETQILTNNNRLSPSNSIPHGKEETISLIPSQISKKINLLFPLDKTALKYELLVEQIKWKGNQDPIRYWNFSAGGTSQEFSRFFVNITRGSSKDVKDVISLGAQDCSQNHASLRMTNHHQFFLLHNQGKNGTFVQCLPYQPINSLNFLLLGNTLIEVRDVIFMQKTQHPESQPYFSFKLVAINIDQQENFIEQQFELKEGQAISLGRTSQDFSHQIFENDTKLSRIHGKIYYTTLKSSNNTVLKGQQYPILMYQDNGTRNGSWMKLKQQEEYLFSHDFHFTIGLYSSLRIKIKAFYDSKNMRNAPVSPSGERLNHPSELLNQNNIFTCSLPEFNQSHKHDPDQSKALLSLACGHVVCYKSILDKRDNEFKNKMLEQTMSTCPVCQVISTFSLLSIA